MEGRKSWRLEPAQYLSLFTLALVLVLVLLTALANWRDDGTRSLAGRYPARFESPEPHDAEMAIPSRLPLDAVVSVEVPVLVSAQDTPPALLFSQVRYALEVYWDDALLASQGRIGASTASERSDHSLLVPIPQDQATLGDHMLRVRYEGAWGEGGVYGDVRFGKLDSITRRLIRSSSEGLALSMSLWVLAIIQLMVLLRRPDRREHLYLGMFFFALATFWFTKSDIYYQYFQDLDVRLRVRRPSYLFTYGFAVMWTSWFAFGRTTFPARAFITVCSALAAAAAFWPDLRVNALVNNLGDMLAAVVVVLVVYYLWRAPSRDRIAVMAILAALVVAAIGIVLDVSQTLGFTTESEWAVPMLVLMVVACASAQSLKHSDAFARYASLLNAAPDGIVVINPGGDVDGVNPAAMRLLRAEESALPGDLPSLFPPDLRRQVKRHVQEVMEKGEARAEVELRRLEGSTWLESLGRALADGQVLLILRNITDRRRVEAGLMRTARLETVGYLAGGVAQDMGGLLGALQGQMGALHARFEGELDVAERLNRMEGVIRSASNLARRLRTLAAGTPAAREPVDLGEVARTAVTLVQPALSPGTTLRSEVAEGLPPVDACAQEMVEVLVNLLVNSAEAVPREGGILRVVVRPAPAPIRAVEVRVEDNGPGVPPERRAQIFDTFFSTKDAGGAGLGLAVVAQVVRAHGGDVQVDDSDLGGACFQIRIPTESPVRSATEPGGARRVMVVDDEEEFLKVVHEVLADRGFHVVAAASYTAAMERWRVVAGEIDLLVTDVVLGDGSGLDLAKALEKERPSLKVVLISGFIPRERVPQVVDGHWRLLDKPFRLEQLVGLVREQLESR